MNERRSRCPPAAVSHSSSAPSPPRSLQSRFVHTALRCKSAHTATENSVLASIHQVPCHHVDRCSPSRPFPLLHPVFSRVYMPKDLTALRECMSRPSKACRVLRKGARLARSIDAAMRELECVVRDPGALGSIRMEPPVLAL